MFVVIPLFRSYRKNSVTWYWYEKIPICCNPFIQVLSEKSKNLISFSEASQYVVIPLFRSYRKNHWLRKRMPGSTFRVVIPLFRSYRKNKEKKMTKKELIGCNPFIQVLSEKSTILSRSTTQRPSAL